LRNGAAGTYHAGAMTWAIKAQLACRASVSAAVGLLVLCSVADAAVPPHLDEMPAVDRVLAIQGRDRLDTAARQVVSLQQLIQMVATLSDGRHARDQLTGDERRIVRAYTDAIARVEEPILASFGIEGSHRQQMQDTWLALRVGHAADEKFRQALLERFFSRKWQVNYWAVESRRMLGLGPAPPRRSFAAGLATSVVLPVVALGAAALIVFLVVRALVRRRRASTLEPDAAPYLDVLEASASQALRDLRRATAVTAGKRSRR